MILDVLGMGAGLVFLCHGGIVLFRSKHLLRDTEQNQDSSPCHASVLISARNEEAALPATLSALLKQDHPGSQWELIVVDDSSTDGTAKVAAAMQQPFMEAGIGFRLLSTDSPEQAAAADLPVRQGKKQALLLALYHACHEHILVLDADCDPPPSWVSGMLRVWRQESGLLAGGCIFALRDTAPFFSRVVRLEYMMSLLSGLISLGTSHPAYASGANLAWTRTAFREAGGYQGLEHIASADDTLLLQRIARKTNFKLQAVLNASTTVETRGPSNLKQFLRQRIRWNSTQRHFPDRLLLFGAIGYYLIWLFVLSTPLFAILGWLDWKSCLIILCGHFGATGLQALAAARSFNEPQLLPLLPMVWLLQLLYVSISPLLGLFARPRWRKL